MNNVFAANALAAIGADVVYAALQMLCVSRTCAVAMGALILCDVDALAEKIVTKRRLKESETLINLYCFYLNIPKSRHLPYVSLFNTVLYNTKTKR